MPMMNPQVDLYLSSAKKWREELQALRLIILDCGLKEELKWSVPIYTYQKSNIVGINGLKNYCALAFFKGLLLKDSEGILTQPGKHTQAGRWIKFTSVREILKLKTTLNAYIHEAIEVEKAGLKVPPKKTKDFEVPEEFQKSLNKIPGLKAAFKTLTPGRQRVYLLYFSAPKLSKTRESRIEKSLPKILVGKGLTDR